MRISSPSRKMRVRKPSHFGSKIHPSPGGSSPTRFASMGIIGGLTGRCMPTRGSYRRRPAGRVLASPVLHGLRIIDDASRRLLHAQLAFRVLRDVAEMAEGKRATHIGDGGPKCFAGAYAAGEVLDVCGGVRVVAGEIEAVGDCRLTRLTDDLALHVVVHEAVTIEHDRSVGAQHLCSPSAAERLGSVAALALPDQRLAIGE